MDSAGPAGWARGWPRGSSRGRRRSPCSPSTAGVSAAATPIRSTPPSAPAKGSSITTTCASPTTRTNGPARGASARCTTGCRGWAPSSAGRKGGGGARGEKGGGAGGRGRRPPFFERLRQEHTAVREQAGLFDMSSFGKVDLHGPGALPLLQRLADNNLDADIGKVVYTQFLNARGGVVADVTITRLATRSEEHTS